ncbi:MAG TPA: hypothetical protein VL403_06270, partial [Candidatus Kryptonia bacterium]|nr:hypothetical protein [Candidatus Kryptonia bacterium]
IMEGLHCYNPPNCSSAGLTLPLINYDHGQGCAVMGGYVYRGCAMPDLHGTYFYGDLCSAFIRSFQVAVGVATNLQDHSSELGGGSTIGSIASFGQDARGELYVVDINAGKVFEIVPRAPSSPGGIPALPHWGMLALLVMLFGTGSWLIWAPRARRLRPY